MEAAKNRTLCNLLKLLPNQVCHKKVVKDSSRQIPLLGKNSQAKQKGVEKNEGKSFLFLASDLFEISIFTASDSKKKILCAGFFFI